MEDQRRDAGNQLPTPTSNPKESSPASAEPATTRRRKRKNNYNANIISNSTPSKRLAKEKASIAISSMHTGPYTRAAAASASPAAVSKSSLAETVSLLGDAVDTAAEEGCFGSKELQALEAEVEAEFEAIKSRDANVHVVPTHCGWFSWKKVHLLEEQMLPSFFTKKSEDRTPDIYFEIRNWIMKKYHSNPNTRIEIKDLLELIVGDLDARQEVMEFLDHWGLINFHPFPPTESLSSNVDNDKATNNHSLVENLYHFDTLPSYPQALQRTIFANTTVSSRLFPEPSIAEDLVKPEKPGVDYHCNSCSADCSRKRYHCQTEADYDLCTECFVNGKFGSTMSSTDFILMEPAEVLGGSGGNWSDQETLLLLEALELYKENWNEIAEHVSTKTKAQCILHFVQMPIEDIFLGGNGEADDDIKENPDPISAKGNTSVSKDTEVTMESQDDLNEGQPSTLLTETSKPECADGIKLNHEKGENCAVKALRDAFEAVGSLLPSGGPIKFSEAGNPVMALAAFLSRLVGPDIITASTRCSVKSLSGSSPGMMIASRNCFVLEDPPNERKEPVESESSVADSAIPNSKKDENQKEEKSVAVPSNEPSLHRVEYSTRDPKNPDNYPDKGAATKELDPMVSHGEIGHNNLIESQKNPTPMEDQLPSAGKESDDTASKEELVTMSMKESGDEASVKEHSQPTEVPSDAGNDQAKECSTENNNSTKKEDGHYIDNVKRAAITALSAAAVKSKILADQEEDQIRQLATLLMDKQLQKLETKLACFGEMDSVVMRVREHLERSRQKLYQERAQIIAARLGLPASSSRPMTPSLPTNRPAMNFTNLNPRPSMNMIPQRPLTSRPMMSFTPPSNQFASTTPVGGSLRPSNQDKHSSMGMK